MQNIKQTVFVEKPKEPRAEHIIKYTDIEVSLGAPWISREIVDDFINHIVFTPEENHPNLRFTEYEPITGNWQVDRKRDSYYLRNHTYNLCVKFGTDRYNALYIIEAILNLREIRLTDVLGKYDEIQTVAALEKKALIEKEFKDWIWQDEDRIWEIEEAYNSMFAHFDKKNYDGSKLIFNGMSDEYDLYDYQRDAVHKILDSKNTLLAFDVGAGKTYIMIAAAMKMRQESISRKNMFVVPNHIVGQWEKIFTSLYPKAKVLAIEPKMFKPEMRQKVLTQIKNGDYDGIIIAYSCFEMIPISDSTVLNNMDIQLNRVTDALNNLRKSYQTYGLKYNSLSNEMKRIKKLTGEFLDSMVYTASTDVTFEDLEITTLFLDEAHNYKNLPINTKMKNLVGINLRGSRKCMDMLHKIRYVQNSPNGRGAVFATGTPLCNSISDAYTMQVYLQFDDLQKAHLDTFDNWVKTFAKPEQLLEIDVDTSKYRMIRRFARFFNLPELSRMFSQVAMFYAVDESDNLPEFEGYTDIVIDRYDELTNYMLSLCERTEEIRSGKIDKKFDNMLKVSTDGRKAALDLTLVGAEQPYDGHSKIVRCVENVIKTYNEYPGCTQLIFCDYSTPKKDEFNVYKELKQRLKECGIPEKEIAFIHSYNTESKKVELFEKFNSGKMRVLLGSTFKLGIGANVQTLLKAVHHLDVPWRPADMVQREGRILRQGNENESVKIYRYISEGSFDSYSWQILETKQRFISQFLSGSSYQRSVSDLEDNVLTYAEVKALALSEPLMKQLAQLENEVKSLKIVVGQEKESFEKMKDEKTNAKGRIHTLSLQLESCKKAVAELKFYSDDEKALCKQTLTKYLTEDFIIGRTRVEKAITALCFTVQLPKQQDEKKPFIYLVYGGSKYRIETGPSPSGNAQRVMNFIKNFDEMPTKLLERKTEAEEQYKSLEQALNKQDMSSKNKLMEKQLELTRIQELIKSNLEK